MTQLFLRYIAVALPVSVLIAVLAAVRPLLQKRYRARLFCWLWLVLAVRLLLPVRLLPVKERAPVQVELPSTEYVVAVDETQLPDLAAPELSPAVVEPPDLSTQDGVEGSDPAEQLAYMQQLEAYETEREAYEAELERYEITMAEARRQAGTVITLPQVLCCVWLAGVVVLAVWQTVAYLFERKRILRNAVPMEISAVLQPLREELALRRTLRVLSSGAVTTPLALGLFRPVLVLPDRAMTPAELEMVCRHELTHICRGDIAGKLLLEMAVLVHWYDPLVRLARRLAAQDMELACDEAVLSGKDAAYRAGYAESILRAAALQPGAAKAQQPLLSTGFSGGKRTLKQRFAAICSTAAKHPGRVVLIAVLCLALLAGGVVAVSIRPAVPAADAANSVPQDGGSAEPDDAAADAAAAQGAVENTDMSYAEPEVRTAEQVLEQLRTDWDSYRYLAEYMPDFYIVEDPAVEGGALFTRALNAAEREELYDILSPEQWQSCGERRDLDWQQPDLIVVSSEHTRILVKGDTALVIFWTARAECHWYAMPEGNGAAAAEYCAALPEKPYDENPLPAVRDCVALGLRVTPWDDSCMPLDGVVKDNLEAALQLQEWRRCALFTYASGLTSSIRLYDVQGNAIGLVSSDWSYTMDGSSGEYREYLIPEQTQQIIDRLSEELWSQVENASPEYCYMVQPRKAAYGEYAVPKMFSTEEERALNDALALAERQPLSAPSELQIHYTLSSRIGNLLEIGTDEAGALFAVQTRIDTMETETFALEDVDALWLGSLLYAYDDHAGELPLGRAVSPDGRWKLWEPVLLRYFGEAEPDGYRWVLEDTQRGTFYPLCGSLLPHGTGGAGFWENGDLYITEPDGLHVYTAADGYRTHKEFSMTFFTDFDAPALLHAVRRDPADGAYLVLHSRPVAGQSEYFLTECDAAGVPLAEYATGVPVVWRDETALDAFGTCIAREGDTLTVLREYGVRPYDTEPVFRFDLVTHVTEDLSDQLMGLW